jgi:hypothetical protein
LAYPWEIINLCGLLSHNIDILSLIDRILSNFDLSNLRGCSHDIRIEPMAFEYEWIRSFATLKIELVYFFYYAVVVVLIGARRTNSNICGFLIQLTPLVVSCVKAIATHIINDE